MADPVYEKGIEIRSSMFGAESTQEQMRNVDDFTRDLQDLVTRYCFGEIWGREELSHDLRSMLTIAMLVALGREQELKIHVRGAIANGVTKNQIREILLHGAIYCGIPAAVGGFRAAREVFADLEQGVGTPDPTRD